MSRGIGRLQQLVLAAAVDGDGVVDATHWAFGQHQRSAVHRALRQLAARGYVEVWSYGPRGLTYYQLTAAGWAEARRLDILPGDVETLADPW